MRIWTVKTRVKNSYFTVGVVGKTNEIRVTQLLTDESERFVVDRPIVCVRELAKTVGVKVLLARNPHRVQRNVVLGADLKDFNCELLEMRALTAFLDDTNGAEIVRADLDCFVLYEVCERLQAEFHR